MTAKVDMTLMHQRLTEWAKATGVSMSEAVEKQAGLLKIDLMNAAPPKSLKKSRAQAARDAKKTFFGRDGTSFAGRQRRGRRGMTWLYAGKKSGRFLVGTADADFQPQLSAGQMKKVHGDSRGQFRGAGWHFIGVRGRGTDAFSVWKVNRVVVRKTSMTGLQKLLMDAFGKLKAAWIKDIEQFPVARGSVPKWVANHVPNALGENTIQTQSARPVVEIINRSPGVNGKKSLEIIHSTLRKRMAAMKIDIGLYLKGIKKKTKL